MPIELSHLMQLALGQKTSLQVGDLPRPVAEYLDCHPAIVFLGHKELIKITRSHPEIQVSEFQHLSFAIAHGRYIEDAKRPRCVSILYINPDNGELYLTGLKSAEHGSEVWVSTYHRISPQKAMKREKKDKALYGGPISVIEAEK